MGKLAIIRSTLEVHLKHEKDELSKNQSRGLPSNSPQFVRQQRKVTRIETLLEKVNTRAMTIDDTLQLGPNDAEPKPFISVPIPLRPDDNTSFSLGEVGTLNIDDMRDPTRDQVEKGLSIFTSERVEMLQLLSRALYSILTEAATSTLIVPTWTKSLSS
jgi:hypothetical protein